MKTNILAFGQIATITGNSFSVDGEFADTERLQQWLQQEYPQLQHVKFSIALDKKIVNENTPLYNDTTIALLPPFSGG